MKIKYEDVRTGEEFVHLGSQCLKLSSIDSYDNQEFTYLDGEDKGFVTYMDGSIRVTVDRETLFSQVEDGQRFMCDGDEYIKTELIKDGVCAGYDKQDLNAVLIKNNKTQTSTNFTNGTATYFE